VRSMALKSTTKFLAGSRLVFGSLLFIADKREDLSLQEPEPPTITRSGVDPFPLTPVRVGLTCGAWPRHRSSDLGESELDHTGDCAGHYEICCSIIVYPLYKSLSEFDFDGGQKIFMVGQSEHPIDQTKEEIAWVAAAKIARAKRLAREA
jgi:hypothetical protein